MARVESGKAAEYNDPAKLRAFLEADDGREFFMFNLVKIATGERRTRRPARRRPVRR